MMRIFSLLFLLVISGRAQATLTPTPTPAPVAVKTPAPNDFSIEELLKQTSAVRGLKVLKNVSGGLRSRAQIEDMAKEAVSDKDSATFMRVNEVYLRLLGLAPQNFNYRQAYVGSMAEQVSGFYDSRSKEFNLADWTHGVKRKVVAVHELTHALQDQHFDLMKLKNSAANGDAYLAIKALIEGDATFTMRVYLNKNPQERANYLAALRSEANEESKAKPKSDEEILGDKIAVQSKNAETNITKNSPRFLRETDAFPYLKGHEWVEDIYRRGGWNAVNRAYRDWVPQSTEHILHPIKYLVREVPHKVRLADVSKMMGAGWKTLDVDVSGEWTLYLMLDEYLKDERRSRDAAAGWGGDFYALYEKPKGPACMVQMTSWDTQRDALEFFMGYARRTDLRFAKNKVTRMDWPQGGVARTWKAGNHNVVVERRGNRVLIIEGLPPTAQKSNMSSAIWSVVVR